MDPSNNGLMPGTVEGNERNQNDSSCTHATNENTILIALIIVMNS